MQAKIVKGPLTDRERAALRLWGPIVAALVALDVAERGQATFSEVNRAMRRRHPVLWALGWTALAVWFPAHCFGGDDT